MESGTAATISALATCITALFSILIWYVYKGQWNTMNDQARSMREGLAETRRAADAATESAAVSRRTADLTYQSLIMANRARLSVRNVSIDVGFVTSIRAGSLWVTNTGHTSAMILKTYATWIIDEDLPIENPANEAIGGEQQPIEQVLHAGSSVKLELPTTGEFDLSEYRALREGHEKSIYLVGAVKYRDSLTHLHRTFFCRRFDPRRQRFEKVDDPDYEYEE